MNVTAGVGAKVKGNVEVEKVKVQVEVKRLRSK